MYFNVVLHSLTGDISNLVAFLSIIFAQEDVGIFNHTLKQTYFVNEF